MDIRPIEDLLGDKRLLKEVLIEGSGDTPPEGSEVDIHYVGTLPDREGEVFDSSRDRDSPFSFALGHGDALLGLDKGVASMRRGERAVLTMSPDLGYGDAGGCAGAIPPGATLRFDVELIDFYEHRRDKSGMNEGERLQEALRLKDEGNALFKTKDMPGAKSKWRASLQLLDDQGANWDQGAFRDPRQKLLLSLQLNLAQVELKLENFADAILHATYAVGLDPVSSKAHFRRGMARMQFGLLDDAKLDLKEAADLEPKNADIRRELQACQRQLQEARKKDRAAFGGMFGKVDLYDEKAKVVKGASHDLKLLPKAFIDIRIGGEDSEPRRIEVVLYSDTAPLTTENFLTLCTGERGLGKTTGKPLHFKGCPIHRVIRGIMMQSGDVENGDGTGGESIYGGPFEDEDFQDRHDRRGVLSMANTGPNKNGSCFFITFGECPTLNGKHVVFGEVTSGWDVLDDVEALKTDVQDVPTESCIISDCGVLT